MAGKQLASGYDMKKLRHCQSAYVFRLHNYNMRVVYWEKIRRLHFNFQGKNGSAPVFGVRL